MTGAVDDIAAFGFRHRAPQRRGIGAGLRLGEAVCADLFTRQHARQPTVPLRVGAERQQRMRREAVHADRDRDRRPACGDLLEHLQIDLVGLAAATPLFWLRQTEQPCGTQLREHPFGIGLGLLVRVHDRVEHLVGDIAGQRDQVFRFLRRHKPIDRHGQHCSRGRPPRISCDWR